MAYWEQGTIWWENFGFRAATKAQNDRVQETLRRSVEAQHEAWMAEHLPKAEAAIAAREEAKRVAALPERDRELEAAERFNRLAQQALDNRPGL